MAASENLQPPRAILICTVGGSHTPVLDAIKSRPGAYVCFVCSGLDPVTGSKGSEFLIEGEGFIIKRNREEKTPSLPNIPTQAGLDVKDYEIVRIPADNFGAAVAGIHDGVNSLRKKFPGSSFFADYTGGTKSMSAALVTVALATDDIELQLITGPRENLRIVTHNFARINAPLDDLRLQSGIRHSLKLWKQYNFRTAAQEMDRLNASNADLASRTRWGRAKAISLALAMWDDFDHQSAREKFESYSRILGKDFNWMLPTLSGLSNQNCGWNVPARLIDLWLNAERRASQGRFDDAVARWYRLLEWTAQWQIQEKLNVQTSDFPEELLPPGHPVMRAEDEKIRIGLNIAWEVIAHRHEAQGPAQDFAKIHRGKILDLIKKRNFSILAHGYRVVEQKDWLEVQDWTHNSLLPLLEGLAGEAGLRPGSSQFPRQLPTELPEAVLDKEF